MGCLYILGALFYALRVPERFFPGKFDIWVSSSKILLYAKLDYFNNFVPYILNLVPEPSNLPCISDCSCFCALSWYYGNGNA
jgi:hypothetical protein